MGEVCQDGGKMRNAFIGFKAEPGKTPKQSLFRRRRAMADEAFHPRLTTRGRSAATGTRGGSHPCCHLGRSVGPRRFRDVSGCAFLRHGERFPDPEDP